MYEIIISIGSNAPLWAAVLILMTLVVALYFKKGEGILDQIPEQELANLTALIKKLDREAQQFAAKECEKIAQIGNILIDTKKRLAHGQFKAWTTKHLPFDYSTAKRYMRVASKGSALTLFFPLGKTIVYELAELSEEKLKGLTLNSNIKGKRLRDMTCVEVCRAFSKKKPAARTYAYDYIKYLAVIKKKNPELWSEIVDDIVALIADGQMETQHPTGKLRGRTRDERAREVLRLLREALDVIDDVDDVAGKLSKALKLEAMRIAQLIWREVNRLPAYAVLAKTRKAQ